jgi:Carboxypeptidase regulatory-like domain
VVGNGPDGKATARERRRAQATLELQATAMGEVVLLFSPVGKIRGRVTAPEGEDLTRLVVFGVPASMGRAMLSQGFGAMQDLLPRAYPGARVAADGRFELSDVSGSQALIVPHPRLIHALVTAEPDGAEVAVALFKDKAVKGKVTDASGKPVTAFSVNGTPFESSDGSFEFTPPATPGAERPKNLPLIVTADGFQPLEKPLSFGAGDLEVGTLKLEAGRTFTLTVVEEPGGGPVEELTFARLDGTALSSEPAEVLSPGVYRFSRLPNSPIVLSLMRFGGATRKVPVAPGDVQKTFRFGAGATLRGAVKAATGKPAVGARVALSGDVRSTRLTNGEGQYRLEGLEPGPVTLVVSFGRVNAVKKVAVPERGELVVDVELP